MKKLTVLAALVGWLCVACASIPSRDVGYYSRTDHVYYNNALGFRLTLPPPWSIRTSPGDFTVPLQLRPDQEQVLEAHNSGANLGLVIVVQQGPLVEIADLVQKMQAASAERLAHQLARPDATDFRQLSVRQIMVNGRETAEWIYAVKDTTGGQPFDITVSYYITKVGEHYVYLTFSVPSAQYAGVKPSIESVLYTFTAPQSRLS
jgi:hypothetical protein